MDTRVLLVGIEYKGSGYPGVSIESRGLCRPEIDQLHAAAPLYYYDSIIIYPRSYSHFIFGYETEFSISENELYDLKAKNSWYDIDTIFSWHERNAELLKAISQGTKVIWIVTQDKPISFYGWRSLYRGYLHQSAHDALRSRPLYMHYVTRMDITTEDQLFSYYFDQMKDNEWRLGWEYDPDTIPLARSPEQYCFGCEMQVEGSKAIMLTPPSSNLEMDALIQSCVGRTTVSTTRNKYHGIFLSHTSKDKPFVRRLQNSLKARGVENVWVDEAEIMIGDSLIKKIEQGINGSKYFAIVLSPRSIDSPWVEKELEQAMTSEINSRQVKVLPLLLEKCHVPGFLAAKFYADFTDENLYEESLEKLLQRLEIRD